MKRLHGPSSSSSSSGGGGSGTPAGKRPARVPMLALSAIRRDDDRHESRPETPATPAGTPTTGPQTPAPSSCGVRGFRGVISKITDGLYLTGESGVRDVATLEALHVTRILNVAEVACDCGTSTSSTASKHTGDEQHARDGGEDQPRFQTLSFDLHDNGATEDLRPLFLPALDFIEGGVTVCHCQQGVSRSPTFVIAYLMWKLGLSYRAAFAYVQDRRPIVSPNGGFIGQLLLWEQVLRAVRGAPDARMQPHLLRVVLHAASRHATLPVLKEVGLVGRQSLDSRGCFVLHDYRTRTLFVWAGAVCAAELVRSAAALTQLERRYLGVQRVRDEREGAESDAFWRVLGDARGPVAHVRAYDRDYCARVPGRVYRFSAWDPVDPALARTALGTATLRGQAARQVWVHFAAPARIAVHVPAQFVFRDGRRELTDRTQVGVLVARRFLAYVGLPATTPCDLLPADPESILARVLGPPPSPTPPPTSNSDTTNPCTCNCSPCCCCCCCGAS